MTLEEFENQLAEDRISEQKHESRRDYSSRRDRSEHHRRHHHHHRSSKSKDKGSDEDEHRSKRRRHEHNHDDGRHHRHHRKPSPVANDSATVDATASGPDLNTLKRDSWMEAPSSIDIDYVQRKRSSSSLPKQGSLAADFDMKIHKNELNHHLKDLQHSKESEEPDSETVTHSVEYTIGDAGSHWRMTKLKAVYRQAKEANIPVDKIALERYDSLREFDDAREEEIELSRQEAYGKDYVGKDKPNGDLYQERQLAAGIHDSPSKAIKDGDGLERAIQNVAVSAPNTSSVGPKIDQTTLNRMKAQLMKAQLRNGPNLAQLQQEYDTAVASSTTQEPTVITLSAMNNRMLSSAPRNEVRSVSNRRGAERGQVEENEDMSIEDMIREERRTRHQAGGEAKRAAERIAADGKFDNDLDYQDENAGKLAKHVHKSSVNLRNMTINEYQKMNKVLENCPLCHHEDTNTPPIAPIVSLATRTYLTLPTEPELSPYGAMIVPTEHRINLLECDDDEWEEIRNFMKSLTRFYHGQGRDVIFYENAAYPNRQLHAAMVAVALPYSQGETAPAFFQEAFLTTEDEWSQHKKVIDTLAKSKQGLGKLAFRRSLVKEMPYFHVWFEMDGGLGHVVEDADRWPKGDLFAREIIGGMLGSEPDVIKRQGRWHRGHDSRMDGFRKKWKPFDWTRILTDS